MYYIVLNRINYSIMFNIQLVAGEQFDYYLCFDFQTIRKHYLMKTIINRAAFHVSIY